MWGGETAEMPGMYAEGEYDIAGFTVGVVEKSQLIDGSKVRAGDVLVGVASSGVHSNGFSLVRKIVADNCLNLRESYPELSNKQLGEVLLSANGNRPRQHPSMICRILTPGGPKNHRTGEFFPCTQKKTCPAGQVFYFQMVIHPGLEPGTP